MLILAWIGLAFWFANFALVVSWAGHRPLSPVASTGNIIPYNNHGIMYVTQQDLNATHALLALSAVFIAAFGLCYLFSQPGLSDSKKRSGVE